ncbi:amidase signature domain-containing protein [Bombardia bombarda]|uniref:Amidase signature domain-containing protein n=1 Tax=Bombardia bombarda TaxID=252184 RepID=A0AA39XC73_9PEZI|nr:amidase signature domain-containing protein [Bombardia bombarda]
MKTDTDAPVPSGTVRKISIVDEVPSFTVVLSPCYQARHCTSCSYTNLNITGVFLSAQKRAPLRFHNPDYLSSISFSQASVQPKEAPLMRKRFPTASAMSSINVLTATASQLQELLQSGTVTSEGIAKEYLHHIEKHNNRLRALIEVAPEDHVLSIARELDEERKSGKIRGPLHGIPIVVKDNIATHPDLGLKTTGGSFAFTDLVPSETASSVRRLTDAGCLVVGKANLTEFANFKGSEMPCGWSARGGQTQSPYVQGGWDPTEKFGGHSGPGGSSSGSAVAVAAGFAPISIGTETWGSLIMPASRANVFTLKPSRGVIPMDGVMPVSDIYDISGPMAKSASDIANTLDALADPGAPRRPQTGYISMVTKSWTGLRLGAVDTADWRLDEMLAEPDDDWFQQQGNDIANAYSKLHDLGVDIKYPVPFADRGITTNTLAEVIEHNFVRGFDHFLSQMKSSSVTSVVELVEFNKQHADREMPPEAPNQDVLLAALNAEPWSESQTLDKVREGEKYAGDDSVSRCLDDQNIDILLGPADSWLTDFACVAGYPSASLPLSFWNKNGRAFGVIALTRKHREDLLIQLMSAWESVFPCINPPKL